MPTYLMVERIWALSPFLFTAGLALLYSKEIATRIAGGCIMITALGIAYYPQDVDNWYLAVFLVVVGFLVLVLLRPRWLKSPDRQNNNTLDESPKHENSQEE